MQAPGLTSEHHHLQADVVAEVRVERGDDQLGVVVLEVHQPVAELGPVMVVDQRKSADHLARSRLPLPLGELVADQLADRLAPGGQLLLPAVAIELLQQLVFHGDGKADDLRHACYLRRSCASPVMGTNITAMLGLRWTLPSLSLSITISCW